MPPPLVCSADVRRSRIRSADKEHAPKPGLQRFPIGTYRQLIHYDREALPCTDSEGRILSGTLLAELTKIANPRINLGRGGLQPQADRLQQQCVRPVDDLVDRRGARI